MADNSTTFIPVTDQTQSSAAQLLPSSTISATEQEVFPWERGNPLNFQPSQFDTQTIGPNQTAQTILQIITPSQGQKPTHTNQLDHTKQQRLFTREFNIL